MRRTKKAQKMIPICAGGGRRKNSEAKISHAEKDMKNLPWSIQYYIVKGSHIQKIMKEKKNREQRDSVPNTMSEKEEKCPSNISREKT